MRYPLLLLACLTACATEPSDTIDLRGPWRVEITCVAPWGRVMTYDASNVGDSDTSWVLSGTLTNSDSLTSWFVIAVPITVQHDSLLPGLGALPATRLDEHRWYSRNWCPLITSEPLEPYAQAWITAP